MTQRMPHRRLRTPPKSVYWLPTPGAPDPPCAPPLRGRGSGPSWCDLMVTTVLIHTKVKPKNPLMIQERENVRSRFHAPCHGTVHW